MNLFDGALELFVELFFVEQGERIIITIVVSSRVGSSEISENLLRNFSGTLRKNNVTFPHFVRRQVSRKFEEENFIKDRKK